MNRLSNEILAQVIDHLDGSIACPTPIEEFGVPLPGWLVSLRARRHCWGKPNLARYATVSRQFQAVVEERTMANIRILDGELETFAAIFSDSRRRALLKQVEYTIGLPTYGDTRRDHVANSAAFEQATMGLFCLLGEWEREQLQQQQKQQKENGETIVPRIGPLDLTLRPEWKDRNYFYRYRSAAGRRYLTLSTESQLPNLQSISALTIKSRAGRALHPSAACALTAAMPLLRSLYLEVLDPVARRVELRRQHRAALAAGLLSALRGDKRLVRLVLHRKSMTTMWCHDYVTADLEQDGENDLCSVLSVLGEQGKLSELILKSVLISERLFKGPDGNSVTWPKLRRFWVSTGLVAAGGQWWYTGDRSAIEPSSVWGNGIGNQPSDDDETVSEASDADIDDLVRDGVANGDQPMYEWRNQPNPATLDKLMEAAAKAVLGMRALESGCIKTGEPDAQMVSIIYFTVGECVPKLRVQWVVSGGDSQRLPDGRSTSPPEVQVRRCTVAVGTTGEWDVPQTLMSLCEEWAGDGGTVEVVPRAGELAHQ